MKVAGLWHGHHCSYCILENGKPSIVASLERYAREKEARGDAYLFLKENGHDEDDINYWAGVEDLSEIKKHESQKHPSEEFEHDSFTVGHHQAHAANAFFSSNLSEALICTFDGGGLDNGEPTATTVWVGNDNKIQPLVYHGHGYNIGTMWTKACGILGYSTGGKFGHAAGTVMALACLGDSNRYYEEMSKNPFSFLDQRVWNTREEKDDKQAHYDLAAALQKLTEQALKQMIQWGLEKYPTKNLCLAGGVVLNCVATTKMHDWFDLDYIYVTPTPGDEGLAIGAAQYLWHCGLGNPRVDWEGNSSSYLGEHYSKEQIQSALDKYKDKVLVETVTDDDVLQLLYDQKIISVYGGKPEVGRRALGNRSILADPRNIQMKDTINEKVKHRQWFRPFAPSILREEVDNWFEKNIDSPYMNFAINFKETMRDKVPAVVHLDGTGRLQTVTEKDNSWYYNFIKKWFKLSGVPILLNTSFNDREPIVETPSNAINCFLGTNIDYLYFRDYNILVKRN